MEWHRQRGKNGCSYDDAIISGGNYVEICGTAVQLKLNCFFFKLKDKKPKTYALQSHILIGTRSFAVLYLKTSIAVWVLTPPYLLRHCFCNRFNKLLCWHSVQEFSQFFGIVCFTAERFSEPKSSFASYRGCVERPRIQRTATLCDGTGEESWKWRPDCYTSDIMIKVSRNAVHYKHVHVACSNWVLTVPSTFGLKNHVFTVQDSVYSACSDLFYNTVSILNYTDSTRG